MPKNYYVTNEELIAEIEKSQKQGAISSKLHLILFDISSRISSRKNWTNYTWKDDMIMSAYIKCLGAVWKINLNNKKLNPFGYFSKTCTFSNIDYVKYEKRQSEYKKQAFDNYVENLRCEYNIIDNREDIHKWG